MLPIVLTISITPFFKQIRNMTTRSTSWIFAWLVILLLFLMVHGLFYSLALPPLCFFIPSAVGKFLGKAPSLVMATLFLYLWSVCLAAALALLESVPNNIAATHLFHFGTFSFCKRKKREWIKLKSILWGFQFAYCKEGKERKYHGSGFLYWYC